MTNGFPEPHLTRAIDDFREARRKAALESIAGALLRRQTDLLSYDQVRQNLRPIESARRDFGEIPLDKIIGSVNRYTDFSRSFLPRKESDLGRWTRVRLGIDTMGGLPPIEVYKVGEVYFVLDGHHRVSVARELGMKRIDGYIIPVHTRVPLSAGDSPDDLIIKAEYTEFLAQTRLDQLRADVNLLVTAPGQYQQLHEHIAVHRYFMGQERGGPIAETEAITGWYDTVYLPVIRMIRERNLLREFPQRSETDLYLWVMEYRHQLGRGGIGWELGLEKTAGYLAARFSPHRRISRLLERLTHLVVPEPFDSGPPAGAWRSDHPAPRRTDHLFDDLLVTLQGGEKGKAVINLAIEFARREDARLTGLHVVNGADGKEDSETNRIQDDFMQRCAGAGIRGRTLLASGQASSLLCQNAPWVDLVLFTLNRPPPQQFFQRLYSGTRLLIRRCTTPLFAVPNAPFKLDSALLAYGPGRKAEEALFIAVYLAGKWQIPLTILTVNAKTSQPATTPSPLERAREYLDGSGIQAEYIEHTGHSAREILLVAEEQRCGFIIMGGYESGPLRESIFGSTVDYVLRSTRRPILICR
ncbi:MAG: universal stress protein [Anaerolineaceae bacterium]|jgi:nucleotide-binding universal stress UspA family protein